MSSSNDVEASRLDRELATSNVNRAATLIGSSMAIFTFLLFFLYPRFSSGQIDPVLFQVTLALIVFTIFAFGFSGLYFYGLVGISKLSVAKKQSYFRRANMFFVLGLLFRCCRASTHPIHNRTCGSRPNCADSLDLVHLLHCASG